MSELEDFDALTEMLDGLVSSFTPKDERKAREEAEGIVDRAVSPPPVSSEDQKSPRRIVSPAAARLRQQQLEKISIQDLEDKPKETSKPIEDEQPEPSILKEGLIRNPAAKMSPFSSPHLERLPSFATFVSSQKPQTKETQSPEAALYVPIMVEARPINDDISPPQNTSPPPSANKPDPTVPTEEKKSNSFVIMKAAKQMPGSRPSSAILLNSEIDQLLRESEDLINKEQQNKVVVTASPRANHPPPTIEYIPEPITQTQTQADNYSVATLHRKYIPPPLPVDDIPPPLATPRSTHATPRSDLSPKVGSSPSSPKKPTNEFILTPTTSYNDEELALGRSQSDGSSINTFSPPSSQHASQSQPTYHTSPRQRSPRLPDDWTEHTSKSTGKKYYYNTITKKTTWEHPAVTAARVAPRPALYITEQPLTLSPVVTRQTRSATTTSPPVQQDSERMQLKSMHLDPQRGTQSFQKMPTEGMTAIVYTVKSLDDTTKKMMLTPDFTVKDILMSFAEKIELWQSQYFSISIEDVDGNDRWLNPSRTLREERVLESSKLTLKIKYWSIVRKLIDPIAVRLYYHQIQKNVIKGIWHCSERTALRLAAYQLQTMYGDHQPEKHRVGFFDNGTIQAFLPPSVVEKNPLDYLQNRLFTIHANLKGMQKLEAQSKYIEVAKRLPMYGVTIFDVTEDSVPRKLGIAEDGFLITKKGSLIDFDFYPFADLASWGQTMHGFEIHISHPDKKPHFGFFTACGQTMSELLSDYYTLFRFHFPETKEIPVSFHSSVLPDFQLFHPPLVRTIVDPNFSRLEYFKIVLLEETKNANIKPLEVLLNQIDENLDVEDGVMQSMVLNHILDLQTLEVLSVTITRTFKYQPKYGTVFIENLSLRIVDLSDNIIGTEAGVAALSKLIDAPFPLEILRLNRCRLGPRSLQTLETVLHQNKTIQQLHLEENEIGDKGAAALVEGMRLCSNYTFLNIAHNGLTEKSGVPLGKLFASQDFIGLNASYNKLGDNGITTFLAEVRKFQHKRIESIDLTSTGLSSSLKSLMVWVSQNSQLKEVRIGYNHMSEKGVTEVIKILRDNINKLAKIDLRYSEIKSKQMLEICESLAGNRRLTFLGLTGNTIKKKAGSALAASLSTNSTLTALSLRNCQLAKPSLLSLLQAIKKNQVLREVDLALNDLSSSEVTKELEDTLAFTRVEDFNIAATSLTSSGIDHVCQGLIKNTSLITFHIDANKLGKNATKIAVALANHKKLKTLTIKGNNITQKDALDFFNTLPTSTTIRDLRMGKNDFELESLESRLAQFPHDLKINVLIDKTKKE